MKEDKPIDEIRRVRQEISVRYGHNTKALIRHYQELEKQYEDRMLRRPGSTHPPRVPPRV